ncbi:adenylate kinase [Toxoplasma gondii TgCatPRC2]|uniref:Adenylate kinase n=4 Tax=Toxoplasma gondii TaxID=5811 RepID=A0A125YLZ1_TOXGV|nr:adenylate kinase [Toxoplasma gondii ME49]EPT27506.1 adenylate kinase [Toxoplasma gondii ME49]ESS29100.1 adenylate kinase [Toxoplasma gondii VEG]KYF44846.1 adenylate kinase [Toxoplasma gondii ARI]KYK64488.1 adenylate kinase [Toxoplasma gondii TgCatPRC2]|eukprot:XP_018636198.1 adenylate kinase [Toxoplasma gondii ME49]
MDVLVAENGAQGKHALVPLVASSVAAPPSVPSNVVTDPQFAAERKAFMEETTEFVEKYHINELFNDLLKELILNYPDNPIEHLIDYLERPPSLRVVIIGPQACVGSQRSELCDKLADTHGLIHVHAGRLIRAYLKKSDSGLLSHCIQKGELVPDSIAIDAVLPIIRKNGRRGCVINGFPRTRVQAVALQESRIVPDKFIILTVPGRDLQVYFQLLPTTEEHETNAARNSLVDETCHNTPQASRMLGYEQAEKQCSTKARAYERHISGVMQQYASAYHTISTSATLDETLQKIRVLGPVGSGKSTQAKLLADWYGVVHVDAQQLVRELALKDEKLRTVLHESEEKGTLLPQEFVLPPILNRLRQADCSSRGWVLEGFPQTCSQAEWLRNMRLTPTQVIALDIDAVSQAITGDA